MTDGVPSDFRSRESLESAVRGLIIATEASFTFVPVSPVNTRSPSFLKKEQELSPARHCLADIPGSAALFVVPPSAIAPAASVGPSMPSVENERTVTFFLLAISRGAARAIS
jgi:hypothetical protein